MTKDHINAKISEALSASLESSSFAGDWEKEFDNDVTLADFNEAMNQYLEMLNLKMAALYNRPPFEKTYPEFHKLAVTFFSSIKEFIRKEKAKVESEIKSALETIDWDN